METDDGDARRAKSVLKLAHSSDGDDSTGADAHPSTRGTTAAPARRPETRVVALASPSEERLKRWSASVPEWLVPIRVPSAANLRSLLSTLHPSVVFLDLGLPDLGGIRGVGHIATTSPTSKIVMLTGHPTDGEALAAARSGAWGYANRQIDGKTLLRIVDSVMREEHWMPRRVLSGLLLDGTSPAHRRAAHPIRVARTPSLSKREEEIARLVLAGVSNKEIATQLQITEATVKAHLTVVFRKLGVTSRLQLGLLLSRGKEATG